MPRVLQNDALPMSEQDSLTPKEPGRAALLTLLFAGFVLTGIATVVIGPLLPVFIQKWSLDDKQAGFFFTVQFTSSMAGVGLSSALSSLRGYRPALLIGYLLMGSGLAALNTGSYTIALLATAMYGCGYGLVVPGTNLLVAEAGGKRSASLLNLLNFAWGIGAVACSPMIWQALKHTQLPNLLNGFAVLGGVMVVGLVFAPFGMEKRGESADAPELPTTSVGLTVAIALGALFFMYVAMETSIGGWAAEHAKRLAKGTSSMTTLAPMFFYGGLMFGRAVAPLVLLRLKERPVVLGALSLTATGCAILIMSSTLSVAVTGVFLAGLGCASIYPIYIAWLSRWYGARAKRIGGIFFALASLGGAVGPWLVGFVSKFSGILRMGLLVPLLSAVIMICLVLLLRRQAAA
jgi:MFS transporter, FHS family, glucose/mannose:H+ symporter